MHSFFCAKVENYVQIFAQVNILSFLTAAAEIMIFMCIDT